MRKDYTFYNWYCHGNDTIDFKVYVLNQLRVLDDFEWKLQYAYANCGENKDKIKEVTAILKELVPEVKKVSIPESCGVDDWQLFGWLHKHNISLKEFLTNKKYVVIQDGDEYCIWKDLINCGLIDKKVIENMEDQ